MSTTTTQERPCTIDDILYHERQLHAYPVAENFEPLYLADEHPHIEPDSHPYSCSIHGLDFDTKEQVQAHLAEVKQ